MRGETAKAITEPAFVILCRWVAEEKFPKSRPKFWGFQIGEIDGFCFAARLLSFRIVLWWMAGTGSWMD